MNTEPLINIFKINLKIKKHEKILVFTDFPTETNLPKSELTRRLKLTQVAQTVYEIGKDFCRDIKYYQYPSLGCHGKEPPEEIWILAFGKKSVNEIKTSGLFIKLINKEISSKELKKVREIVRKYKDDAVNAVVALSNFSTSHTNFRDLLTKICGTRYASMPLFDISMLDGAMNADWKEIQKRGIKLKKLLDSIEEIEIITPNGTEIKMKRGKRKVHIDSGILTKKGSFGNLPAGEVFFAPIEASTEGKLIVEWAPTRKLETPLIFYIKEGKVIHIEGQESYRAELESILNKNEENRNIAELGIGINDKATRPDNILESEKIFGTIHIALGDNSSFGGKIRTNFHQDFIFFNPTMYGISKDGSKYKIISDGKLLI